MFTALEEVLLPWCKETHFCSVGKSPQTSQPCNQSSPLKGPAPWPRQNWSSQRKGEGHRVTNLLSWDLPWAKTKLPSLPVILCSNLLHSPFPFVVLSLWGLWEVGFSTSDLRLRLSACILLTCPSQVVPAPSLIPDLLDLGSESTPPTAPPSSSEGWDWTSSRPFPSGEVSEFMVVSAKCLLQVLGIHCFYPSPSQGVNIQVTAGDGQENSVLSWKML